MKARFVKTSETHHELGIELEPESKEEEILVELFVGFSYAKDFDCRFHSWGQGGSRRFDDGQEKFTRWIKGTITKKIDDTGTIDENTSDGYHTFKELYEHRHALFIKLCREIRLKLCREIRHHDEEGYVWRSKLHSDGSAFEGWFIMGIGLALGEQVSYHLPMSLWGETEFAQTRERAPEFDGHTSADVLERLQRV